MKTSPRASDWIFVSDAHFTGREPDEMGPFLRFLDVEEGRIGHLVILGDLFEFLFGFRKASIDLLQTYSGYLPVLRRLQGLSVQGVRITYIEGNHDFFLGSFFREHFGMEVEVQPEALEEQLEGKRAFVAHGDLCNPADWKHRWVRRMLRNRFTYHLIHWVGPQLSQGVARRLSERSYRKFHRDRDQKAPSIFKEFAHRKFQEGFEIVILGHSHFPEQSEALIAGKRCLYFNVGDWMNHRSFLRFTPPAHFRLERFEESGGTSGEMVV